MRICRGPEVTPVRIGVREVVLAIAIAAPLGAAGEAADGVDAADAADASNPAAEPPRAEAPPGGTGSASTALPALAPVRTRAAGRREAELRLVPDGAVGSLPWVAPRAGGKHLAGTAFVGWRGRDGETTGAAVTLSPGGTAFLRIAAEATPRSEAGASRLAWGAGFEDARPDTFFANVSDRGPVRPEAWFTMRDSELSAGYKLPLLCAGLLCLAPTAFATVPLSGGPYVGGRTTLALGRTWYAAAGLGWTVPGALERRGGAPRWRVQYGVGRWDAQPGSLYVAYQDELAAARLGSVGGWRPADRQARGVLTAGVTWAR